MKLELDAPNVGALEKKYLNEVIDKGFVSTFGPFIPAFEQKIAGYLGVASAAAVQSGTAAIHMALHVLGIGPGDEVIVPAVTFTASVNPVLYVGATPVIVDVDPKTWNMDPARIKQYVTTKTKAIIPVHLYGNPCDMTEIMGIAQEHGLYVIEDATESLGAQLNGRHTGAFGDFGCFSFNGNKLLTTGGGGMVAARDPKKIDHVRYVVNQSKDKDKPNMHSELGFNARMTNVEAALGLAQFERIEEFLNKKKAFYGIYHDVLGKVPGINFQELYAGATHSGWMTCVTFDKPIEVLTLMQDLHAKGIPTRRIFAPIGEMAYLKQYATSCPCATTLYHQGLCLPSSTLNDPKEVERACHILKECIGATVRL